MAECKVVVEFRENSGPNADMRWERAVDAKGVEAFTLLGRAFEITRRESDGDFHEALAAFFRGALMQKEDVAELLLRLDEQGRLKPS